MADAKINLETFTNDEGLKRLNSALAEGAQAAAAMQKELRDLEKATQSGTNATAEQARAMQDLREKLNAQKQVNAEYNKAIKDTVNNLGKVEEKHSALGTLMDGVAGKLGINTAAFTSLDVAAGMFAGTLATKVAGAIAQFVQDVAAMGAAAEKSAATFAAWKPAAEDAAEAGKLFNTVGRDTNYDLTAVKQWGMDLVNLGYSANNAAYMIKLCADTAAGLGKGQAGAQQLIDTLSRIQATGEMSSRQMIALQQSGLDMDKAFESLGMTAEDAMQAMDDGTLNAQDAVASLTDYMHTFDGSMAESKQNIIDEWGDVEGNLSAICGTIGASIFDAFDKSGIVQTLIDFTQDLLDLLWSDGESCFTEFGQVGQFALSLVNDALEVVFTAVKAVILIGRDMINAFRSVGQTIAGYLAPILSPLAKIWNLVSSIVSALGHSVGAVVDDAWASTVGATVRTPSFDDGSSNHFHTARRAPKASGGSAGGSSSAGRGAAGAASQMSAADREEERALDSLIKKYTNWVKYREDSTKHEIQMMKQRAQMLTGEAAQEADRQTKLLDYKAKYDELMDQYEKELDLTNKIADANDRKTVHDRIAERIRDAKELYDLQIQTVQYQANLKNQQANTKSLMGGFLQDPDSVKQQLETIKTTLTESLAEIDSAMAQPVDSEQLSAVAQILGKTPDALQEEMDAKGTTIQEFMDNYKNQLVEAAEAESNQLKNSQIWKDTMKSYWNDVSKSLGDAFYDIITGAKSAGDALAEFVSDSIKNALKMASEWLGLVAIFAIGGNPAPGKAASKALFGMNFATGGYVAGPGTGTSDSIPAMLSNGEYVITSQAVNRIGRDNLDAINAGRVPDLGSSGGVTAISGGNVTLNVSAVDASGFSAFLQRGGLDAIKQALFDTNRNFAAESGVW